MTSLLGETLDLKLWTVNQLINIVHKIYCSLDNDHDVLIIFLDVAKAFDKVFHKGPLHKLECLGIDGFLLKWFENYLKGRFHRVVLNGQSSEWREINSGVPQGSILGPLLFLIFVNDLVDDLSCDPFLFADDTSLFKTLVNYSDEEIAIINDDIKIISNWADQWRVTFNASKTTYMIFSKKLYKPDSINIIFNGAAIKRVDTHCHLGLHFKDNLNWDTHVTHVCTQASKNISLLRRLSLHVDRRTKLLI